MATQYREKTTTEITNHLIVYGLVNTNKLVIKGLLKIIVQDSGVYTKLVIVTDLN